MSAKMMSPLECATRAREYFGIAQEWASLGSLTNALKVVEYAAHYLRVAILATPSRLKDTP